MRRLAPVFLLLFALVSRAETVAADVQLTSLQQHQFQQVCARCHARPNAGAPLVGDVAAWTERNAQGFEVLLRHTIDGWRTMPPLGTCGSCGEADLRILVSLVSGLSDPAGAP